MSGILGLYQIDQAPASSQDLDRMTGAMAYWGRDGRDAICEGPIALGHVMSYNTPESVGDVQPRRHPGGRWLITARSRLDNRNPLASELGLSIELKDAPDSAFLLAAYDKWGIHCVDHLLGDFSFAIWDRHERALFLARDHFGNTGIYYHASANRFAFASSIKAILALPDVPQHPDPIEIGCSVLCGHGQGSQTSYRDISRLPPAHALCVTARGVRVWRYWSMEDIPEVRLQSDQEYDEAFRDVFGEAVRCRLRSHRPVGLTLSAGLDSTSVAALSAPILAARGQRLPAFTSVPVHEATDLVDAGQAADESALALETARYLGNVDVELVRAAEISPLDGVVRALDTLDDVHPGMSNAFWLSSLTDAAGRAGMGALLIGLWGNVTTSFGGGFYLAELCKTLAWRTLAHEVSALALAERKSRWRVVAGRVARPLVLTPLRASVHGWLGRKSFRDYTPLQSEFVRKHGLEARIEAMGHHPHALTTTYRESKATRRWVLQPRRSKTGYALQEYGANAHLEFRDPTADKRVIEFCLGVPLTQHVQNGCGRLLIRRGLRTVMPPSVLSSTRRGKQAADLVLRLEQSKHQIDAALQRFEASALAAEYLDVGRMKALWRRATVSKDAATAREVAVSFMTGVLLGLMLLRFEGVSPAEALTTAG